MQPFSEFPPLHAINIPTLFDSLFWSLETQVSAAGYDRQGVADHANNLASKIRNNLTNSMKALGVDILTGVGTILVSCPCWQRQDLSSNSN